MIISENKTDQKLNEFQQGYRSALFELVGPCILYPKDKEKEVYKFLSSNEITDDILKYLINKNNAKTGIIYMIFPDNNLTEKENVKKYIHENVNLFSQFTICNEKDKDKYCIIFEEVIQSMKIFHVMFFCK